jgi:phage tail-like protein
MPATARSQSTDPFSMNKFHVLDTQGILNLSSPAAGFNTCTSPELTLGIAEYQEGIEAYRRKYPGEPTVTPVTLTKGIVKTDTTFYQWVLAGAENQPYRTNLIIRHYHRDDVTGLVNYQTAISTRELRLAQALPSRVKMGNDFDSTAADISIEDIDIEYESLRLFVNGVEIKSLTTGSQS